MCGGSTHWKETSNGRYGNENIVTVFHWTPTPARFPHKVGSEVRLTIIAERALAWSILKKSTANIFFHEIPSDFWFINNCNQNEL
jgi:hypothetical protein